METIIVAIVVLLLFDLAAYRWGFDSTDGFRSREWERRRARRGRGGD